MQGEEFAVSTVGGVFNAGEPLLGPLKKRLYRTAPGARLGPPAYPPEVGAIRLALDLVARDSRRTNG